MQTKCRTHTHTLTRRGEALPSSPINAEWTALESSDWWKGRRHPLTVFVLNYRIQVFTCFHPVSYSCTCPPVVRSPSWAQIKILPQRLPHVTNFTIKVPSELFQECIHTHDCNYLYADNFQGHFTHVLHRSISLHSNSKLIVTPGRFMPVRASIALEHHFLQVRPWL